MHVMKVIHVEGGGGGTVSLKVATLGGYLPQVWVPTVKRTPKAVAVKAETEERWDISEGACFNIMTLKTGY